MHITDRDLQAWSASDELKLLFAHLFCDSCDYQRLLDRLSEEDMPEEANWLMDHAGQDRKAVLNIDCVSKDKKHVFAAGDLVIEKGIVVDGWLRAGGNINAGEEIYAGLGIVSGAVSGTPSPTPRSMLWKKMHCSSGKNGRFRCSPFVTATTKTRSSFSKLGRLKA